MILKPFMLRRIKKDVENELSDKIEIMVHCPLTIRQKLLYIGKVHYLFICILFLLLIVARDDSEVICSVIRKPFMYNSKNN